MATCLTTASLGVIHNFRAPFCSVLWFLAQIQSVRMPVSPQTIENRSPTHQTKLVLYVLRFLDENNLQQDRLGGGTLVSSPWW